MLIVTLLVLSFNFMFVRLAAHLQAIQTLTITVLVGLGVHYFHPLKPSSAILVQLAAAGIMLHYAFNLVHRDWRGDLKPIHTIVKFVTYVTAILTLIEVFRLL